MAEKQPASAGKSRLEIKIPAEVRAKLHERADALGLDDAAYVRMLVFRDVNGGGDELLRARPMAGVPDRDSDRGLRGRAGWDAGRELPGAVADGRKLAAPLSFQEDDEQPRAEEMDIPPDPDGGDPSGLDDLLRAGPSILDQAIGQVSREMPRQPARNQRNYRANRGMQAAYGPGSITRAVGVNEDAVGHLGSAPNTVLKDNMRHFGIVGTRAR